jgi:glycosyltransferase involved in cell wall biosynthesis
MYPNRRSPSFGIFVQEQARKLQQIFDLEVMAPVPWFPFINTVPKYKHFQSLEKEEYFNGIKVYRPRYFLIPKFFKFLDYYLYFHVLRHFLAKVFKNNDFDIIHSHWGYPDGLAGLRWSRNLKKKCILTVHGNESICFFERSLRKKIILRQLKNFDHIITVSNDLRSKLLKEYSVPGNKVTIIPNGIDTIKFFPIDKIEAKIMCGLNISKKYILSVCRLSPEKGLEYLLRAFSLMANDDLRLIIVGDGMLRDSLTELSRNLNIDDKTIFIREINHGNLYKYYNAADVFCLPSLWEGSPCTIIESMACGTPIVSTNVGGIPDIVTDKCGLLVGSKNSVELSDALKHSITKQWNREIIVSISKQYAWSEVTNRIQKVYERIMS